MEKQVILNATQLELTLKRLSHELIETHNNFENSILIGLQPRGIHVTTRIKAQLEAILTQHDVLFTGRTIRAGLDALLTFGRPSQVQLLALIDRRFSRDLPIQADYIGKTVDTLASERVAVEWNEIEGQDQVLLFTKEGNEAAKR